MGGFRCFACERVEDAQSTITAAPFSYSDRVLDPRHGERSAKPHGCPVLSRQRTDESLIWNRVHCALVFAQYILHIPLGRSTETETAIFCDVSVLLAFLGI
jgi:hypothetical protein